MSLFLPLKTKLNHPSVILAPLFIFLLMNSFMDYRLAVLISLFVSVLIVLMLWTKSGARFTATLMAIPIIPLSALFVMGLLDSVHDFLELYANFILEIITSGAIFFYLLTLNAVLGYILRGRSFDDTMRVKAHFWEFVLVAKVVLIAFTIHIISVSIYYYWAGWPSHLEDNNIALEVMPIVLTAIITIYEVWRASYYRVSLDQEQWLPIVNSTGAVKGVVARSVTFAMGNKHCNPVVRIVLEQGGMLFLNPRPSDMIIQTQKLDQALGAYLPYRKDVEPFAKELIEAHPALATLTPRLLLKYIHEDESTNRLVFLFLVQVPVTTNLKKIFPKGKLWTRSLIDANLQTGTFSTFFEEEYSFLKNTILLQE